MKKLVLSGFFGFDNAGDEAILFTVIQQIRKRGYEPIVLSANPAKTSALYGVESVHRMKLKEIFSAIKRADGLISGGGSLLQDVTSAQNSIYYLGIMQIAFFLKKPVFVFAQGIGPLQRKGLRRLTGSLLNRATYLSVRDDDSKSLLRACGVKKEIDVTVDPVLQFELMDKPTLPSSLETFLHKKPIVFSLRSWHNDEQLIPYYQEVIRTLNEKGIPVLLLPFHQPSDTTFAQKVQTSIENPLLYTCQEPLSLEQMFSCIQQSSMVYGMRLHALIFAASQNIPFVGLSYDPKIDAFLSLYKQTPIATVESFNANQTLGVIYETMNHLDNEQEKLHSIREEVQRLLDIPLNAIDIHFSSPSKR